MFFRLCLLLLSLTAKEALSTANVDIVLSSASGEAVVHSTVLLVCVAGGNVTPEVTWHFSGNPIQTNVSMKHAIHNTPLNLTDGLNFVESILEICDIEFDDRGEYTCNASAEGVSSNSTTTVTVRPPPGWQVNITGVRNIEESDMLELTCTSDRLAVLSWFKKENSSSLTKILPTSRISIDVEGSSSILIISSVTVSDNLTYVCEAQDGDGFSRSANHTVQVNAVNECETSGICQNGGQCTDLESGYSCTCTNGYSGSNCEIDPPVNEQPSAPNITEVPANTTIADIGTPINLTCTATGNPPPTYQWLKDGVPIPQETRSFLYIAEASPEERGNYTCVANNSQGKASEDASVDIQGILQYTAQLNFSNPVDDVDELLLTILNSNLSTSSVYAVEVLNDSPQKQMFTLLITLINISSSSERSAALEAIESSLTQALMNVEIPADIPTLAIGVQIQRYDGCNPDMLDGQLWPETDPGSTAIGSPCPCTEAEGLLAASVIRRCVGTYGDGAQWGPVDDSPCRNRLSGQLCLLFQNLTNIENASISEQVTVSQVVRDITSMPENLTAADVSTGVSILSQLTTGATMNATLRDNYLQIIDNIQQVDAEEVLASQTETRSSQTVLQSLQTFQDNYVTSNASNQDNETIFTFNTFAIKIQEIDTSKDFEGQSFSVNLGSVEDAANISGAIPPDDLVTGDNPMDVSTKATASIQLPIDLFMSCGLSGAERRLSYSVFLSDVLFQNETQLDKGLRVGSIILAPRLQCNKTLTTPITVSFRTNEMIEANASRRFCGSWSTGGSGAWTLNNSYCEGDTANTDSEVESGSKEKQGRGGHTARYRHLAHFGILFDVSKNPKPIPPEQAIALQVISYVGLVTSLLCLTVFLISYFSTEKLRTSTHGQILINMCLALMGLYIFFLISGHATSITILCGISSALLQYFILVFFGWTLVEVVWLYLKLVKVFGIQAFTSKFMLKAGIPTWVVPLLVVAITAGPGHQHYYTLPYCRAKEWPFYAGTIVPFGLVYIINWIMFVIIMASICKHTKGADHKKGHKVDSIRKNVVIALTLATIFGLGWGIGLAATSGPIRQLSFTFQIIFSVMVGLQGTLIFMLHGIRNKDVRKLWKRCFARIGGKSLLNSIFSSTKSSSAGQQSLRGTTSASGTMPLTQKKSLFDDKEHMYDTVADEESGSKSDNGIGHMQYTTFKGKDDTENLYTSVAGEETKCDLAA